MDLHPNAVVPKLAEQHAAALVSVHRHLQEAVPETYSRFSDRHPDPAELHGMVMCTAVRDTVLCLGLADSVMEVTSLTMAVGPARSVVLRDGGGTRIRVRKFPTDRLTGDRVRVVEMPEEPTLDEDLFGPVVTTQAYDLYVLWSPHVPSASLDAVFLAAVSDIDSASRVRVHAAVQLPPPPAMPGPSPEPGPGTSSPAGPRIGPVLGAAPTDDFDDQIKKDDQHGTST